ncbi:MAG: hypothetical protein KKG09_06470 [Verrucomicrobia bacterium]|nr:hypothetical protein [Verrucomicrobiota bacterium]MCG2679731.1 hypothetical protein [Kiritimatiellia bacterium]MBU4247561.1 hypothetical protein [Verrucomicrobiota bacterium]MBU4290719.1 hypothetical protein [Verrucomicrobiota bacterium]MBU4428803.1 hypothetical protein [Verrucomicrobiota bacterium]
MSTNFFRLVVLVTLVDIQKSSRMDYASVKARSPAGGVRVLIWGDRPEYTAAGLSPEALPGIVALGQPVASFPRASWACGVHGLPISTGQGLGWRVMRVHGGAGRLGLVLAYQSGEQPAASTVPRNKPLTAVTCSRAKYQAQRQAFFDHFK